MANTNEDQLSQTGRSYYKIGDNGNWWSSSTDKPWVDSGIKVNNPGPVYIQGVQGPRGPSGPSGSSDVQISKVEGNLLTKRDDGLAVVFGSTKVIVPVRTSLLKSTTRFWGQDIINGTYVPLKTTTATFDSYIISGLWGTTSFSTEVFKKEDFGVVLSNPNNDSLWGVILEFDGTFYPTYIDIHTLLVTAYKANIEDIDDQVRSFGGKVTRSSTNDINKAFFNTSYGYIHGNVNIVITGVYGINYVEVG